MTQQKQIYLDHNSTTPLDPAVIKVMTESFSVYGNPSSVHNLGQKSRAELIRARRSISNYFKVKPQEIVFTSGGTEGLNTLIRGLLKKKCHIISSLLEHSAVIRILEQLQLEGYEVTFLGPGLKGAPTTEEVKQALKDNTGLIVLMAVNNETGVKTPWREIATLAEAHRIPFVVDGVALLGREPIHPLPRGVTGIVFSGHKIHAPKGIGFFILRSDFPFTPLIFGGGQESQKRGGTENFLGIIALAKAIEILEQNTDLPQKIELIRTTFETKLREAVKEIEINGEGIRSSNVSNIAFHGVDGESLLFNLDLKGIYASHGSACSSGSLEPSRILTKMGLPLEKVRSSIRFSFSRMNTLEEIEEAVDVIKEEVFKLRALLR